MHMTFQEINRLALIFFAIFCSTNFLESMHISNFLLHANESEYRLTKTQFCCRAESDQEIPRLKFAAFPFSFKRIAACPIVFRLNINQP
jgi:hypothetical protein